MNEQARSSEPPDEPYLRSEISLLSPASPKPLQFPQPTNIPVLENMMNVEYNQTEAHMNDPAMRNTELRPDAWRDPNEAFANESTDQASPFSTGGRAIDATKADGQQTGIDFEGDVATSHSNETAANAHDAQSAQLSNGISHIANSQLQTDVVPEQTAPTDEPLPMPDLSFPSAAPDSESAPTNADVAPTQSNELAQSQPSSGAVDVQALLDTLQTSVAPSAEANVAPSAEGITVATTPSPSHQVQAQQPVPGADLSSPLSASGLGAPPSGLPPRPPPQVQPLINSNYAHSQHIQDYHPHGTHSTAQAHGRSNSSSNVEPNTTGYATQQSPTNPTYQPSNSSGTRQQLPTSNTPIESRREYKLAAGQVPSTEDQPWTADIQKKYDHFMEEERRYVNEAKWDQFPVGSRLFVGTRDLNGNRIPGVTLTEDSGNLSSEKVTKRDIFHVFHNYGELAQISIKQAYGFVQFLTAEDCGRALAAEQGRQIRDKRIHLEISKPQKSNKNQQQQNNRRSRSPDYSRGRSGNNNDRYVPGGRGGGGGRGRDGRDSRDSRDSRDGGYRHSYRSPSPRGYRERYDDQHRPRSRSPQYDRRYRGQGPRRNSEDDCGLPRRQARDVPDVQILALEQLDRDFLSWVEKSFSSRGVRADVLIISSKLNEEAVVKRQIMEGVLAISKLRRANQNASKIGLTIFKRKHGTRDVNFEDYDNLDPHICVELVLREKAAQGRPPSSAGTYNGYPPQYGAPTLQYGYQQPPPSAPPQGFPPTPMGYPPGYGQPQTAYGMPPQGPPTAGRPQPGRQDPNLQSLLSTLNQASPTASQAPDYPPQGYPPQQAYAGQQDPYAAMRNVQQQRPPGPPSAGPPGPPAGQGHPPNMQDILARLGTYGRQ